MRQAFVGLLVTAVAVILPGLAMADNQEIANQIAKELRSNGQLSDYAIGVKYEDGTAWLKGRVCDQDQMNAALKTVFQTPGVTRVVNGLTLAPGQTAQPTPATTTARFGKVESNWGRSTAGEGTSARLGTGSFATEPTGTAMRLQRVVDGDQQRARLSVAAGPATGRASASRAQRVASSFTPAPAQQVAAAEPVGPVKRISIPGGKANGRPIPIAYTQAQAAEQVPGVEMPGAEVPGGPIPAYVAGVGAGAAPMRYDQPNLPNYSWPSYAAYPNYAAVTYPRQYSPTAWPYIGPFYPYPQVPLGWRKVTLEWDDGWWMLDFKDSPTCCSFCCP